MIREADLEDIKIIQSIARITWPIAFREILSESQISYMLEMMYSNRALTEQIDLLRHRYLLAYEEKKKPECPSGLYTGYLSYELNYNNVNKTKIHKIYILPQYQGCGYGKALIQEVKKIALSNGNLSLTLNVNRNNNAIDFYKSLGFKITAEEDIDIGNGFLMEDYKMEMSLK